MSRRFANVILCALIALPLAQFLSPSDAAAQSADPPRQREGRGERRPPGGESPEGRPERRQRERPDVEGSMKALERALERLEAALPDAAKRDDCLRMLGDAQRALGGAKAAPMPKKALDSAKDEAEKARIEEGYRRDLLAAARLLLDIEEAVLDKKPEVAAAKLKALNDLRDETHKRLGVED